jgi:voltage-gated potassium channel
MNDQKLRPFGILISILSVYALFALAIGTFAKLSEEVDKLIIYFDHVLCVIFFGEFLFNFYKAESKMLFMKWGWIDLLSCVPLIGFLRTGRLFRLIRIFRIIRAFRNVRQLVETIFRNRIEGTLSSVFVLAFLILVFSSISILQFEDAPNSNIRTAEDAIWWSYSTMTTVGYGDIYPVTTEGRIIAMILMTVGVGLFGTFTAIISSKFMNLSK